MTCIQSNTNVGHFFTFCVCCFVLPQNMENMNNMEHVGAMIKNLVGCSSYHFHRADQNPQGTVCLTYITQIYTMFHKMDPFFSFIIHPKNDQFTRNFYHL